MARSVNKVLLIGHIGKDPEVKYTPSGAPCAKFSLATNERTKQGGEWKDSTEWHNIIAWQKLAEVVGEYAKKGSQVYVEGRLQTSSWDDRATGQKKYRTEIIASQLVLLGGKGGSDDWSHADHVTDETVAAGAGKTNYNNPNITDEDIPF